MKFKLFLWFSVISLCLISSACAKEEAKEKKKTSFLQDTYGFYYEYEDVPALLQFVETDGKLFGIAKFGPEKDGNEFFKKKVEGMIKGDEIQLYLGEGEDEIASGKITKDGFTMGPPIAEKKQKEVTFKAVTESEYKELIKGKGKE